MTVASNGASYVGSAGGSFVSDGSIERHQKLKRKQDLFFSKIFQQLPAKIKKF